MGKELLDKSILGQQGVDNQGINQIDKEIVQVVRVKKFSMQENPQIVGVKLTVFLQDIFTASGYEASQLFNFSLNSDACGGVNAGNFEISLSLYPSLETDWIYVWLVQAGAGMVSLRSSITIADPGGPRGPSPRPCKNKS